MSILSIISLFLGIANPTSLVLLIINSAIFGLLLGAIGKNYQKYKYLLLIISTLLYSLITLFNSNDTNLMLVSFLCILSAYALSGVFLNNTKKFIIVALAFMIFGYILVQLIDGVDLRKRFSIEPAAPYNSDMTTYLKVTYLMKRGENFYQALYDTSKIQLNGNDQTEIWGWRQPFLFYLWTVYPSDGRSIIYLGVLVFSINLIAVYFIGRKFLPAQEALLCPYIVWPYFKFPLIEQTIAQAEWWALSAFIIGIAFFLYNKRWAAGIMFAVCLGIRELLAVHILFVVLVDLFNKNIRQTVKLIIPSLLVLLPFYLFIHIQNVAKYVNLENLIRGSTRENIPSGWMYIRPSLSYNSWSYALVNFRPFLFLLIFNSFILLFNFIKTRNLLTLFLLSLYLPFFLISLKIGTYDLWHDYWGIYYVPLLLMVTPISINYLLPLFKFTKIYPR